MLAAVNVKELLFTINERFGLTAAKYNIKYIIETHGTVSLAKYGLQYGVIIPV